jgi:hypothetical protein
MYFIIVIIHIKPPVSFGLIKLMYSKDFLKFFARI